MLKAFTENGAMALAACVLAFTCGCDNSATNNAAKPSTDNAGANAPADAPDPAGTAAKIEASHQRTGLDQLPPDIPSHHLTEPGKSLDKPAAVGAHGGTLIRLNALTSLELVLDRDSGTLTAYVLDAGGEQPVAIRQDKIRLHIYWSPDMDPRDNEGFSELTAILRPAPDAAAPDGSSVFQTQDRDFARRPGQFILKIEKLTSGDQSTDWAIYHFPAGIPWQPPQADEAK
jgi:hypothetical protein